MDLVVVVADNNMEAAMDAILSSRRRSVGIRPLTYKRVVLRTDSACLKGVASLLRSYLGRSERALVMFDRHGCGREDLPREKLESDMEASLSRNGWNGRAAAIVFDPELEVWVWSDSPNVDRVLGGDSDWGNMREWLSSKGYSFFPNGKPVRPKEAMEAVLRRSNLIRSSARYQELAKSVSLERCTDAAFLKLKSTLANWFPDR